MLNTILGFKQKMGFIYIKDRRYPVTWVKVDPCIITQIKHTDMDGYMAIQLGTGNKRVKNITKPLLGHLNKIQSSLLNQGSGGQVKDKNQKTNLRYLREIRINEDSDLKVGDNVKVTDVLKNGDMVTVTGVSKGKGFAGVVKRWKFAGGPKTHGQSDRERSPGSIGQRTTPGRIYKGKKMAGRMGSDRVTVKSLNVIDIDETNNLVAITGAVPGITGGLVFIKKTGESGIKVEKSEPAIKSEDEKVENQDIVEKEVEAEVQDADVKETEESDDKKAE